LGRAAPPPLDPRRLADRALAVAACAGSRRRLREEPAFLAVALEGTGQPAPQPGPRCADPADAAGLDRAAGAVAMDAGRARSDVRSGAWRQCVRPDTQTQ